MTAATLQTVSICDIFCVFGSTSNTKKTPAYCVILELPLFTGIFCKNREISGPCREIVRKYQNRETLGKTVRLGRSVILKFEHTFLSLVSTCRHRIFSPLRLTGHYLLLGCSWSLRKNVWVPKYTDLV